MQSVLFDNRYEIIQEIGWGGAATVYRATDLRLRREVALKVLRPDLTRDPIFRKRFENEVRTILNLSHPSIVPLYDFGEHEGQPYLVMGYMEGGSLAERIARGPLDIAETLRILKPLSNALDVAHANGIIHRDLKPGNVLFDRHDLPYLSDFGIAKSLRDTKHPTQIGHMVGTLAYMAPERTNQDAEPTPLIDIYALGVTLFEMLTGQQPYRAETPHLVLVAALIRPIPNIREIKPGLPDDLQLIIEKAMAKDPLDRYQTAGALAADLERLVQGKPISIAPPSEATSPGRRIATLDPSSTQPVESLEGESLLREVEAALTSSRRELREGGVRALIEIMRSSGSTTLVEIARTRLQELEQSDLDPDLRTLISQVFAEMDSVRRLVMLKTRLQEALSKGNTESAEVILWDIEREYPDDPDLDRFGKQLDAIYLYRQAQTHRKAGELAKALELLKQVDQLVPGQQRVKKLIGELERTLAKQARQERLNELLDKLNPPVELGDVLGLLVRIVLLPFRLVGWVILAFVESVGVVLRFIGEHLWVVVIILLIVGVIAGSRYVGEFIKRLNLP